MSVGDGRPGPGRPKGSSNKITRDIKEAILHAFEKVGGASYLETVAKDNPQVFCTLLGKILPTQIAGDPDSPVVHRIERVIVRPSD